MMNLNLLCRRLLALVGAMTVVLSLSACDNQEPNPTDPQPTTLIQIPEDANNQTAFLGNNLYITDIGNYTGIYMEDGSDEFVENVLMIVLENRSDNALQLARISLLYSDFTANFEVTNLPAGQTVVLLEKNRQKYLKENFQRAIAENVAFFQQPMSLREDQVKLTGSNGVITVENLTDQTFGEVYIYYKNSSVDLFYGGITYRARLEAGLKPGESAVVATNHYYPEACTIIDVQILPVEN